MSDPRHSATLSTLRARGRHALPWLRRNRANRWKVLLAPAILGAAVLMTPALGTTYTVCASGCAFTSIQAAIDDAGTQAGDTISLAGETYAEAVTINKQVTLVGVGSSTVIDPPDGLNAITITGSGASAGSRLIVKDLKVTGAEDGIYVATGDNSPISYITLDGITATANNNNGINFNNGNTITDVLIDNSTITSNGDGNVLKGNTGVRIATNVPTVTGFVLEDSTISLNRGSAFSYNPSGTLGKVATGVYLRRLTISNNVQGFNGNAHDISIAGWGSTSSMYLSDITVTLGGSASSSLHGHGIVFQGKGNNTVADWQGAGTISLSNITVTGSVPKTALYFLRFTDTTGVSLSGVDISAVTAGWGAQFAIELPSGCGLNLGNTVLKRVAFSDSAGRTCQVNGQSAVFKSAASGAILDRAVRADNFTIEDQVTHSLDNAVMGFLRWKASNVFVTSSSGSIQRGINAASSGDTVNVKFGAYTENLSIDRVLNLNGAKAGVPAGPSATPAGRDVTSPFDTTSESVVTGGITISGGLSGVVTVDGLIIESSGDSVYLNAESNAVVVQNCILVGRSNAIQTSGASAGITKLTTNSGGAVAYAFEYNWIKGGRYGVALNSGSRVDTVSIRGNYMTGVQRGIQTNETYPKGSGIVSVRDNYFSGVTKGIRFAQGGHTVVGNTVDNLVQGAGGTSVIAAFEMDGQAGGNNYGPITILNNSFSSGEYGVLIHAPVAGQTYTVRGNSLTGATTADLAVDLPDGGASVDATGNWWGQSGGPGASQVAAAGATITTSSYLTSSSSVALFPGFWPKAAPASTVTEPLSTTTDAPPVVAAIDLGGGASTSLVLDFGAVTASGSVTVQEATQPSDGNFSFGGNSPISITFSGTFTPPVKVCLSYDDSTFPPGTTPELFHYTDGVWSALTTVSLDTVNKVICANTDSFSIFVPGIAATNACTLNGSTLEVDIPTGLSVSLAKSGSTLDVTFDPTTYVCGSGSYTIGSSGGQIRTVLLTGDAGDETVTFENATSTNWGANSTSNLARTIDLVSGSGDMVVLEGTAGSDAISAIGFATLSNVDVYKLDGLAGADTLTGTTGAQYLYGGIGSDTLKGDAGDDFLYGGADNDSIQGGTGTDCLDYSAETSLVTVNLTAGTAVGDGIASDTFGGVECAFGGDGDDTLIGSSAIDRLYGGDGDDTISGRGANDLLFGEGGSDTVTFSEQTTYGVTVSLAAGTASGTGIGSDTLTGFENATGGSSNDTITGSTGANVLSGGPGSDSVSGGGDADTLNGGTGNDTLIGGAGNDSLTGGDGTDTASYSTESLSVAVDLTAGTASGSADSDTLVTIENAVGGSNIDSLTGNSGPNVLSGGAGVDTILGGQGADTLYGGDGADSLQGEAGADALYGDAGADELRGGSENDTLRGGADNDTLIGGSGDDLFYGEGGSDTVSYDSAYGSEAATGAVVFSLAVVGTKQPTGGAGGDTAMDAIENLTGSAGNDKLTGSSSANTILGLEGNDTISGGDGNDTLNGGTGTNTINGGAGTDICTNGTKTGCEA